MLISSTKANVESTAHAYWGLLKQAASLLKYVSAENAPPLEKKLVKADRKNRPRPES